MDSDKEQEHLKLNSKVKYGELDFSKKKHLKDLTLYDCEITVLDPEIFKLINLKKLTINDNDIINISGIRTLTNLEELDLGGNYITEIPDGLLSLQKLKKIDLSENCITKIPENIDKLKNLEELDLSGNYITEIPDGLLSLQKLRKIILSENRITKIPENIDKLENLKILELTDNYLKELPNSICNLNLEKLLFSKNKDLTDNYPKSLNGKPGLKVKKPEKGDKKFSHFKNRSLYYDAKSMVNGEEYESALKILNKILKEEQCGQTLYSRGYCYLELEEYHKACEDFTAAIELEFDKEIYFSAKAVAHSRLDEFEDAIKNHSKAIGLNPSVQNYQNRAIVHKKMGEYERSVDDFTKAIEMAKVENSELYVLRAAVYKRMGELTKSWEDLDTAVEVDPDNLSTYLDTLEMYITTESYREGFAYIEKHGDHVLSIGNNRDKLLFLYLKATVFICLNMGIESFEDEIKKNAKEGLDLEWYFGHTRNWLKESKLMEDKKDKIEEITDLVERK
ncbi:MAG: leucine-rich repeat protein [Desulfobacterales bacterium]|nr:leucine-rich repeat protein [Desulfobacterales bacterium]